MSRPSAKTPAPPADGQVCALFAVDIAWGKLLSWGPIGVLRTLDTSNAPDAQKAARPQDQGEW